MTTNPYQRQERVASGAAGAEPFIDKKEAARRLNCGMRTVDTWMHRGILPYYKVSKRVLFKWSDVEAVLERRCRVDRT